MPGLGLTAIEVCLHRMIDVMFYILTFNMLMIHVTWKIEVYANEFFYRFIMPTYIKHSVMSRP